MTHSRAAVRALLEEHGLSPSRALGQNFVADANTVRRIARLAGVGPGDHVVEIGAGLGSLTLALAETGAEVVANEIDRHLLGVLREVVEPVGVRVIGGDARTVDWAAVLDPTAAFGVDSRRYATQTNAETPGLRWHLVANLPYNVATSLVIDLLADVPAIEEMLVMVQLEVGERLAARPGSGAYGIPSVKVAYYGQATVIGKVPPTVFIPQPKVDSALVRIRRHATPPVEGDPARIFDLVDAGFGQRRKMLRRSLADVVPPDAFAAAGIRPEARAEELLLEDWARLAAVQASRP